MNIMGFGGLGLGMDSLVLYERLPEEMRSIMASAGPGLYWGKSARGMGWSLEGRGGYSEAREGFLASPELLLNVLEGVLSKVFCPLSCLISRDWYGRYLSSSADEDWEGVSSKCWMVGGEYFLELSVGKISETFAGESWLNCVLGAWVWFGENYDLARPSLTEMPSGVDAAMWTVCGTAVRVLICEASLARILTGSGSMRYEERDTGFKHRLFADYIGLGRERDFEKEVSCHVSELGFQYHGTLGLVEGKYCIVSRMEVCEDAMLKSASVGYTAWSDPSVATPLKYVAQTFSLDADKNEDEVMAEIYLKLGEE